MRILFCFIALLCLLPACTTKYYLVRHAERQDSSLNSSLSAAGLVRANVLRDSLASKGIDRIYASTFQRTQQTAQPLATALGLPLTIYSPDTTAGLIAALQKIGGMDILVVGHSNTIPQIVQGLCGEIVTIPENDFDNLFIIRVKKWWGQTKTTLVKTTYGLPTQ